MEGSLLLHFDWIKSEFISTVRHMSSPSNPGRDSNAQSAPLKSLSLCHLSSSSPVHVFFCGSSVNTLVHAAIKGGFTPQESVPFTHSRTSLDWFSPLTCSWRPQNGRLPHRGYIHSAWVPDWKSLDVLYCMRAAERWKNKVDFCFQRRWNVPLDRSGHQTQAGDLSGEEGVQDEDDGLRTRVEVQLLEEKGENNGIEKVEQDRIMQNMTGV